MTATTAGTGSEVTRFTIITDEKTDEKMLCVGVGFMPVAALVDYTLTLSLPARITADTGIDALTHAIEAYVSRKANTYSDGQALLAMRLIGPNLRKVYHDGADAKAREAMMLGSTLAGVALLARPQSLSTSTRRPQATVNVAKHWVVQKTTPSSCPMQIWITLPINSSALPSDHLANVAWHYQSLWLWAMQRQISW